MSVWDLFLTGDLDGVTCELCGTTTNLYPGHPHFSKTVGDKTLYTNVDFVFAVYLGNCGLLHKTNDRICSQFLMSSASWWFRACVHSLHVGAS